MNKILVTAALFCALMAGSGFAQGMKVVPKGQSAPAAAPAPTVTSTTTSECISSFPGRGSFRPTVQTSTMNVREVQGPITVYEGALTVSYEVTNTTVTNYSNGTSQEGAKTTARKNETYKTPKYSTQEAASNAALDLADQWINNNQHKCPGWGSGHRR